MADAEGLNPSGGKPPCGFESRPGHVEKLGHSTIAVTLDTYSHVVPSLDADAAETVAIFACTA